jgi:hypothetical protein
MAAAYRDVSQKIRVVGLKSFILSPFVDEGHVEAVVREVLEARGRLGQG